MSNPQFVPAEIVTAEKMNELPKGVIGYAEITASASPAAPGPTDIPGLSVTVSVTANRRIRVTVYASQAGSSVAADRHSFMIREGSTTLNVQLRLFSVTSIHDGATASVVITPSAGSHTYKASAQRIGGTGTLTWGAAGTQPSFILVEDLGEAS